MMTTELITEQEEMWRTFFDENHADLVIVAEMLLCCHLSPERILRGIIRPRGLTMRGDLWTGNPRRDRYRH